MYSYWVWGPYIGSFSRLFANYSILPTVYHSAYNLLTLRTIPIQVGGLTAGLGSVTYDRVTYSALLLWPVWWVLTAPLR